MDNLYLGIDLGGTKMLAALIDEQGQIVAKNQEPTLAERGAEDVIRRLISISETLIAGGILRTGFFTIRGIGVAVAGVLEPEKGMISLATNLRWHNVQLGPILEKRFHCPVHIVNDANAAAFGEWMAGEQAGIQDMIYITVSTGIGAGIISGGRLIEGTTHSAAEFGHITIDRDGPLCACGNRGCVEMYTAGHSIARRAQASIQSGEPEAAAIAVLNGVEPEQVTAEHVAAAAKAGNQLAIRLLADAGEALGCGIVTFAHLLNPAAIVIGGSVSQCGALLFDPMLEAVRRYGIPKVVESITFAASSLGGTAGITGAALWAREQLALKQTL
ncbi:ROK family protein [Paenibacillus medicaginis]|uniref:ROK family protein n=1 Tax=Paenibacillus medicaginis TaxID=1470560 RepID=A0ABV5C1G2_9BACL